jgi:hypothetical protein
MEIQLLVNEAKRLEEDLLWSKTANFQIATYWRLLHWAIGIPSVIVASATGVVAVKAAHPEATAVLAVVSAIFTGLATFANPQRAAREFHNAGVRYSSLHDRIRRFREIDCIATKVSFNELRKTLDRIANEKAHLMETSPHTGGLAYWLARRSIGRKHHVHKVDNTV